MRSLGSVLRKKSPPAPDREWEWKALGKAIARDPGPPRKTATRILRGVQTKERSTTNPNPHRNNHDRDDLVYMWSFIVIYLDLQRGSQWKSLSSAG